MDTNSSSYDVSKGEQIALNVDGSRLTRDQNDLYYGGLVPFRGRSGRVRSNFRPDKFSSLIIFSKKKLGFSINRVILGYVKLSIIRLGLLGLCCLCLSQTRRTKICPDEKMSWNPLRRGVVFVFGNGREEGEGRGQDLCAWIFSGQNISVVRYLEQCRRFVFCFGCSVVKFEPEMTVIVDNHVKNMN